MAEGEFFRAKKKDRVASRNDTRFEQQRAVQQFRRLAAEQNPNIQMMLPLPDRQSTCSKASATCVVDGQNVPIRRARLALPTNRNSDWAASQLATTASWCRIFRTPMASKNQR
jgi:hypothetical protein